MPRRSHDGVPLPSVGVRVASKETRLQEEIKVESFEKQPNEWVFKTRVLPTGEPLRLRVADVNIRNRLRRKSILRENQVLALQENHLGRMKHAEEPHNGKCGPVTPTPT